MRYLPSSYQIFYVVVLSLLCLAVARSMVVGFFVFIMCCGIALMANVVLDGPRRNKEMISNIRRTRRIVKKVVRKS